MSAPKASAYRVYNGAIFILISARGLRKSTADLDELREFMLITYRALRSIGIKIYVDVY